MNYKPIAVITVVLFIISLQILFLWITLYPSTSRPDHICRHGDAVYMYQVTSRGLIRLQLDFKLDPDKDIQVTEDSHAILIRITP